MLKMTADPHSDQMLRNGKHVGFLQWHPERTLRIILEGGGEIDFAEIMQCMVRLRDKGVTLPEDPLIRYAYNVFDPFSNQKTSIGQDNARAEMGRVLGEIEKD